MGHHPQHERPADMAGLVEAACCQAARAGGSRRTDAA
jgi:hypothetical protein